jgi:hypothetical protein
MAARWQDDNAIQTVEIESETFEQLTVKVTQKSIGLYRKRTKGKRNPERGSRLPLSLSLTPEL